MQFQAGARNGHGLSPQDLGEELEGRGRSLTELHAPLVPADVDLRDFPGMWIDVDRLLKSDTWVLGSGDERAAAFALWAQSWHQVPAGSLPDEPRMLEHLAMSKRWKAVRDHALRGWIRCADGRLYHPVVCEKALEAWIEKLVSSLSGAIGNAKRWNVEIDLANLRGQLCQAVEMLRDVAPQSRVLKKKAVIVALAAAQQESPPESPPDIRSQSGGDSPPDSLKASPPDRNRPDQTRPDQTGSLFPSHEGGGAAPSAAPPTPPPPAFDGNNAEALNGKAVVPIAAGWDLPEQWGIDAEALGWKPSEVLREAEKFRQYWVSGKGIGTRRSVKGWRQTWSNWLDKAAKDRR